MPEGTHVFLSLGTIPAQAMCLGVEFMKYLHGGVSLTDVTRWFSTSSHPPPPAEDRSSASDGWVRKSISVVLICTCLVTSESAPCSVLAAHLDFLFCGSSVSHRLFRLFFFWLLVPFSSYSDIPPSSVNKLWAHNSRMCLSLFYLRYPANDRYFKFKCNEMWQHLFWWWSMPF